MTTTDRIAEQLRRIALGSMVTLAALIVAGGFNGTSQDSVDQAVRDSGERYATTCGMPDVGGDQAMWAVPC